MAKQVHIRVEDEVYEALSGYSINRGQSMQDCVSSAIKQMLVKAKTDVPHHKEQYTFIDLLPESEVCILLTLPPVQDVCMPTNGISTVSRPILPTLESSRMTTLLRLPPRIFPTMTFL